MTIFFATRDVKPFDPKIVEPRPQTRANIKAKQKRAREKFLRVRNAEDSYRRQLKKLAQQVGLIIDGQAPDGVVGIRLHDILSSLEAYAKLIQPWGKAVAARMLADVDRRDANAWNAHGKEVGLLLRRELSQAPTGPALRGLLGLQVELITSLPRKAAERVQHLATESLVTGERAEQIAKDIARSGAICINRAESIARTEVGRAASSLTQVRAQYIGSPGYIWRTSQDSNVRDLHKKLEGQFIPWEQPPSLVKTVSAPTQAASTNAGVTRNLYYPQQSNHKEHRIMKKYLFARALALTALLIAAVGPQTAAAQSGSTPPTYLPTAIYAPATYSATGSTTFPVNGVNTLAVQLSGTYTGVTVTVGGTTSRGTAPTFVNLSLIPRGTSVGSKPVIAASANGVYEVNTAGLAQVKVSVTAISSGSVTVGASGTAGFFHIPANVDLGALITNTAQAAGTVNSPDQLGGETTTVTCVFSQTANTAGNTVFSIQNKDAASGLYYTLITSAAITTANGTATAISAGAGVQAVSNVSASLPVAQTWRVQEVASGTSTTGTVGCNAH